MPTGVLQFDSAAGRAEHVAPASCLAFHPSQPLLAHAFVTDPRRQVEVMGMRDPRAPMQPQQPTTWVFFNKLGPGANSGGGRAS